MTTDAPFNPTEAQEFYEDLGLPLAITTENAVSDERPNPASTVVVQVPDVNTIEFDDSLIEHLDLTDGQQRAEASRILFAKYGAAALGIPKGTHRTNWNSLIHQRISMHLGRRKAATVAESTDTLRHGIKEASAAKVADTAAMSTQAALRVLKDQILDDEGSIDMERFAALLKEA